MSSSVRDRQVVVGGDDQGALCQVGPDPVDDHEQGEQAGEVPTSLSEHERAGTDDFGGDARALRNVPDQSKGTEPDSEFRRQQLHLLLASEQAPKRWPMGRHLHERDDHIRMEPRVSTGHRFQGMCHWVPGDG